jgi:hypothetical protein
MHIVDNKAEEVWKESIIKTLKLLFEKKTNDPNFKLAISIDAAWNKRGYISLLGNFSAIIVCSDPNMNGKCIFGGTRSISRTVVTVSKTGQEKVVFDGNHSSSSAAMESEMFLEFITWPKL